MRRQWAYALGGLVLSGGAPAGLLTLQLLLRRTTGRGISSAALREEVARDGAAYAYVGFSTAVAFSVFGFVLGRLADRLVALTVTDHLTGLANARGLLERLDAALAHSKRYREPLSLLLVDLDGLKAINDRYGHQAGDEAIRGLAAVIRSELRTSDVGARWGGDEFAIIAPNTSEDAARALAERIRTLIPEQGGEWPLSGSIGVATLTPDAVQVVDGPTLMRAADAALYEAKRRGRNLVVSADPQAARGGFDSFRRR